MFKSTLLLATALFLITAPAPDAADLAEATHGLIADSGAVALGASERVTACPPDAATAGTGADDRDTACAKAAETP